MALLGDRQEIPLPCLPPPPPAPPAHDPRPQPVFSPPGLLFLHTAHLPPPHTQEILVKLVPRSAVPVGSGDILNPHTLPTTTVCLPHFAAAATTRPTTWFPFIRAFFVLLLFAHRLLTRYSLSRPTARMGVPRHRRFPYRARTARRIGLRADATRLLSCSSWFFSLHARIRALWTTIFLSVRICWDSVLVRTTINLLPRPCDPTTLMNHQPQAFHPSLPALPGLTLPALCHTCPYHAHDPGRNRCPPCHMPVIIVVPQPPFPCPWVEKEGIIPPAAALRLAPALHQVGSDMVICWWTDRQADVPQTVV